MRESDQLLRESPAMVAEIKSPLPLLLGMPVYEAFQLDVDDLSQVVNLFALMFSAFAFPYVCADVDAVTERSSGRKVNTCKDFLFLIAACYWSVAIRAETQQALVAGSFIALGILHFIGSQNMYRHELRRRRKKMDTSD